MHQFNIVLYILGQHIHLIYLYTHLYRIYVSTTAYYFHELQRRTFLFFELQSDFALEVIILERQMATRESSSISTCLSLLIDVPKA